MKRKRLRGFRRHLRKHQEWAATPKELDVNRVERLHYHYEKLGLAPWMVSEKPPLAIRKLWVGRLIADFYQWQKQLKHHYFDCYLAVWLFEPDFGESQLVAAIEERKTQYKELFGDVITKPLPAEYGSIPGIDLLQWTARANIISCWPEDFAEMGSWASRKPHWLVETPDGKTLIAVQTGLVWVGQEVPRNAL